MMPGRLLRISAVLLAAAGIGSPVPAAHSAETARISEISISTTPVAPISPLLYGANYVWHLVPAAEFRNFDEMLRNIAHSSLVRYPGGWAAEWYDWATNSEPGNKKPPEEPGIDPETFLAAVPRASFVTPSALYIRDPSQLETIVGRSVDLVRRYGSRVKLWEIGNEWWLQRDHKDMGVRQQNLAAYGKLVAAVVPAMKKADPSIEIYVTGDWIVPAEFATLRRLAGEAAWSAVDGISIHPYCGAVDPQKACGLFADRVNEIRSLTGKDNLYASEWSYSWSRETVLESGNYGIRNADQMVAAIQRLAFAHVHAAAYWPAVRGVPDINFVSQDYRHAFATGRLFGWMAQYYRDQALSTRGDLPAAAAKSADGVTVFVPAMDGAPHTVRVPLAGTGLTRVVSAEVMFAPDLEDRGRSRLADTVPLPAAVRQEGGQSFVEFGLDPGTPGRGAGWEIARVTLQ
jgi:hypothetical protein